MRERNDTVVTAMRYSRLVSAKAHLEEALGGVVGMPTAERAVRDALRIVARQAGKAHARIKGMESTGEVSGEHEGADQAGA